MKLSGFRLFRIRGIEVTVDYSWFILFFLGIYLLADILFPARLENYPIYQYWIMGTLTVILFFLSILAHELAHSFVAIKYGIKVTGIRLIIFGGLAHVASEPKNGKQEFLIAIAGPAASMGIGVFFLVIYFYFLLAGKITPVSEISQYLAAGNIILAVFNMIPGFPLDGGRVMRAFLWDRWDDLARATKVVSQIGNSFALFLIIFGVMQFFVSKSLVIALLFLLTGLLMKQSAAGSYQAVMLRRTLEGVQVRQVMTENVVTVDWLISVAHLVHDYIYKHQFKNFPVFDRDEFVGMVSLGEVKEVSKDLWEFKQVRDIMLPREHVACLKPTDDAGEALSRMTSNDIDRMPVVEEGRLVGIVSRRDIMNLFKIKSDLGVV
jgi:Zn-dependent protease/predicted transcriptional regulator